MLEYARAKAQEARLNRLSLLEALRSIHGLVKSFLCAASVR
jgi:hypothetical protein